MPENWKKNTLLRRVVDRSKGIYLPGPNRLLLYDVLTIFLRGVYRGALTTRAAAVAFNFLLAIGPAIIFILTLIPYLSLDGSNEVLLKAFKEFLPENAYGFVRSTFNELFVRHSGLQLFGFLTSLFFATKGIDAMIAAFNASYHDLETRPYIQQKIVSVILVFILSVLIFTAIFLVLFSKDILTSLVAQEILKMNFVYHLLLAGRWLFIFLLIFMAISFLYYLAPQRKTAWRFISIGSTVSTVLFIIVSLGFSYFVNNFAPLNRFFGSIGTLIALMLWLDFISLTLLVGFEINASIHSAVSLMNTDSN